ncbi:Type I secretion system ATP-binding protein PrsD [Pseudovibrio axinellae]|uniref:Type I secretion system ATP-binding protein PrsD n=1 Tax=Pseudovibrio axinellae TaxID=989403 RepID=A0A165WXL3_9HYPH|nr:ATP-binding cassette domain-containing protein [Pseudovibrio axinellae]KZL17002.1 Type I secretion system ATP-binding protein PrsD [Pseudovibrio axinellae]SER86707.1 ABC-type bacteriocin/lantibiotic exporter, contains an N-terminal double-glycine peptidase domain [Pseudovibrio axinellae]
MSKNATDFLYEALAALGGRRSKKLVEAVLGQQKTDHIRQIEQACALLGATAIHYHSLPASWSDGLEGALVTRHHGKWVALVRRAGKETLIPDDTKCTADHIRASKNLLHIRLLPEALMAEVSYADFVERSRQGAFAVAWQSLGINLCALTVPFFTMAVYDRVLGGGALATLPALLGGATIVLVLMIVLRRIRSSLAAAEYARLSASICLAVAQKIFRQPLATKQRMSADALVLRLKSTEQAAGIFASPNIAAIYDAPFLILTLIALVFVGGIVALIPAAYLLFFWGFGIFLIKTSPPTDPQVARLSQIKQGMTSELVDSQGTIYRSGLAKTWLQRFERSMLAIIPHNVKLQKRMAAVQSLGTALGTGTALLTLIIGVDLVLVGSITPGALIGTMLLTWRVTAPAQALFFALPRLGTILAAWQQLRATMQLPSVAHDVHSQEPFPQNVSTLSAQGVYFRYDGGQGPACSGITFDVPHGSVVAVIGPNSSGKTTLLRIIAGYLRAQSGSYFINNRTVSQFDSDDMAEYCAYLDANPPSTEPNEQGYKNRGRTSVVEAERDAWNGVIQKDAPIYVLDDPLSSGGERCRTMVKQFLKEKRGKATVFFSSHDTDLVPHADLAIVLENGVQAYFGPVQTPAQSQ